MQQFYRMKAQFVINRSVSEKLNFYEIILYTSHSRWLLKDHSNHVRVKAVWNWWEWGSNTEPKLGINFRRRRRGEFEKIDSNTRWLNSTCKSVRIDAIIFVAAIIHTYTHELYLQSIRWEFYARHSNSLNYVKDSRALFDNISRTTTRKMRALRQAIEFKQPTNPIQTSEKAKTITPPK